MFIYCRANSPRPTFAKDMTDAERETMNRHIAYWTEKAKSGHAIVFGPVAHPEGVFGVGVYQVRDEEEFRHFLMNDPANGLLQYEYYRMPNAVLGGSPASN